MLTPNASYLGCAEPSWANSVPEAQLRGTLTLAALMSERVYLSDVHLGDNLNFFSSFLRNDDLGLYRQFRELTEAGVLRLLLRDASFRQGTGNTLPVNTFLDVYHNWIRQDASSAWIVPPGKTDRSAFLKKIDSWVPDSAIERYDYSEVKSIFMEVVRSFGTTEAATWWIQTGGHELTHLRQEYDAILHKDWFSLSDFYSLFQRSGLQSDSGPMLLHGLLNEVAYSRFAGTSLVGADLAGVPLGTVVWPEDDASQELQTMTPVDEIMGRAARVLEAPDLSVVALLRSDEVMELRQTIGRSYFDMLNLALDPAYLGAQNTFELRLADAAAMYWQGIADHLSKAHPSATHRPRKLAVWLGRMPLGVGRAMNRVFTFAVNVGLPALGQLGGPMIAPAANAASKVAIGTSLRFLFFAEADELRNVRRLIPDRAWLTRPTTLALPGNE